MDESTLFPLLLVWPRSGIPGKYTLDEVKIGHYLLWDYIAKSDDPCSKPDAAYLINQTACYACAYATPADSHFMLCRNCPLYWGENPRHTCVFSRSLYNQWLIARSKRCATEARRLATQIRDMPWKYYVHPLDVSTSGIHIVTAEQFKILLEQYKEEHNNG